MAGVALSGMASGLDTETMITQLMALESQSKTRMLSQQKQAEGRKSAIQDVARQLRSLSNAATDLRSSLTWGNVQKATSSDDTKVSARSTGASATGSFTVNVTQLARSEQRTFAWASTPSVTINGTPVDLSAATTAAEAAAKINAATGAAAYAGVVNGQLTLTGKELGTTLTVTGLTEDPDPAKRVLAQKTQYTINGIAQDDTTSSVVSPGGLPGVELTLKNVGTASVSVTPPGPDLDKVKTKLKAFVDAYNTSVDMVSTKLSEKKLASPTVTSDYVVGQLRGDTALSGLLRDLRSTLAGTADSTADVIDSLGELGVSLPQASSGGTASADALAGKLVFDETKLAAALAKDPAGVKQVLAGAGGISEQLTNLIEPMAKTTTGRLAMASDAAAADAKRMADRATELGKRLDLREQRLRAQFAALETALNSSQSQMSWIQGQIASLGLS